MTGGPDVSGEQGEATLRWGVKRRFLRHVANLPDGQCSVTDGATLALGPVFVFPARDEPQRGSTDGSLVLRYQGDLRFKGHMGFLQVRIAEPWLEIVGSTARCRPPGSDLSRPLVTESSRSRYRRTRGRRTARQSAGGPTCA
jgi:hypothetical protein